MWPSKLCWLQYHVYLRQARFYNYRFPDHEFDVLPKWFFINFMVLNPYKCSFMLLGVEDSLQTNVVCDDEILKSTKQEKVLSVTLGNKLNSITHLLKIAKNANKKFNAFTRVQKYITNDRKKLIFSSFIKSEFIYCPLMWMFCRKRSLCRIINIHERRLCLLHQNYLSEFERL